MTTGFTFTQSDGRTADVDDILVRRAAFSSGTLWTWGSNTPGIGDGTTVAKSSPITTAGGGITWSGVFTKYSSLINQDFNAAVKTDGTLWTWGVNQYGTLGDGTVANRSSPVTTVGGGTTWTKQGSSGYQHIAAVKSDGTLWTWGYNGYGNLGDGTTVSKTSPITTAGGGTNWRQVACGYSTSAAIKSDGTLWIWGYNQNGQLGDGTALDRSSPVTTVAGGTTWSQVAAGYYAFAAIKTDGTLWTWGQNLYGWVGDGTALGRSSPVTTAGGGTNWRQVAAGAAIKTDGTLWTWGLNSSGQLGDGTVVNRSSPVTTAGGGTNWSRVVYGLLSQAAIKSDGTLWTWGYNGFGALGDGTTVAKSSPVTTVAGFTTWKQIACGYGTMIGIVDITT